MPGMPIIAGMPFLPIISIIGQPIMPCPMGTCVV
jgi:hypothetical protein